MEIYLARPEVRRQVAALVGEVTNSGLAAQVLEARNAMIDAAALKVAQECRWVNFRRRVTVTIGIQENVLNYPAGCSAGSVMGLAVYDSTLGNGVGSAGYIKMEKMHAPPEVDQDQEEAAGGDTFTGVCARPKYWWEEQGQIHTWPFSDVAYPIRMEYVVGAKFPDDATLSVVDAELLIYMTASLARRLKGDSEGAAHWLEMYKDRRSALMAWSATGERVRIASDASFDENEEAYYSQLPNWNTAPTIRT